MSNLTTSKNHKIIAVDFDGVIANTDKAKMEFARKELGIDILEKQMKLRYFVKLFGEKEGSTLYSSIIQSVYHSKMMVTDVEPTEDSVSCIKTLQERGWRCVVVTSRQGSVDEHGDSSLYWAWRFVEKYHFSIQKPDMYSIGSQTKREICLRLCADALVDDDYDKLLPVINAGISGFLFSTETNQEDEFLYHPFMAIRVVGWKDLFGKILNLS